MADITNLKLLYAKAGLLVFLGVFAAVMLIVEAPSWRVVALLAVCVWAFCRSYYFAFYVVQHYADPGYRFAGLIDFFRYAWGRKRKDPSQGNTISS